MSILEMKLVFVVAVFLIGMGGGLMALRLERLPASGFLFSLGSALAGGIFLGAGLIHMLPDAASGFASLAPKMSYPLAFALCAFGFVAILFLEKVLAAHHLPDAPDQPAHEEEALARAASQGGLSAYLLAVVLSFHSLLAGLALGAEDSLAGSLAIFIAIMAHKGSAGFALGVSLHRGGLKQATILRAVALFAVSTPLGIILGAALDALLADSAAVLTEAVFDCLAAGTFLYIAVVDIIQEEFFDPAGRWAKFGSLVAGLLTMALLALWL